jgi:hypothetical protein
MDFTDYPWDTIAGAFVKENILGSEFSFNTNTDITVSIDYLPKIQARKIYTFAKEQLELLKEGQAVVKHEPVFTEVQPEPVDAVEEIEEMETEEVDNFAEIIPATMQHTAPSFNEPPVEQVPAAEENNNKEKGLADLSKEELFDKLQNYKKLLDNGLILQGEYDAFKKEILAHM